MEGVLIQVTEALLKSRLENAPVPTSKMDGSAEGDGDDPVVWIGRSDGGAEVEVQHAGCSRREPVSTGPTDLAK